jgi:excisionase family DNA binding protein
MEHLEIWPEVMKVATAARYADCSASIIRKLIRDPVDPLPCLKLGADIRIARAALDAYLARRMGAAPP